MLKIVDLKGNIGSNCAQFKYLTIRDFLCQEQE